MTDPDERPNPDALLRRMQDIEARSKRGKLKIFFGFAPGVGKTYRMLQVARDLIAEKKIDVVIGIVEDHKRSETAQLVSGLELLPKRKIIYRDHELLEFDLDAALARKPELILVDELAHTNVADSRHAKRWQDVQELLAAGVDVFTTLNVQHVESLNDVVAQITHVQVRERVPDWVLDRADSIELVDIAPEELLQRLKEGKVYLPDQAQRAASHFFQRGNLLALRELALRRTAQHVDEDVLKFREEQGIATAWPAVERVMVCVGPAPSSGRLIRAAARMAVGLRCPWVASYVEATTNTRPMTSQDRERLEAHLRLAESLGATVTRLSGTSVANAVLEYARRHNVTRLVIGKPTHSRFWDRVRGSLLDDVVRGSGNIDVLVITGDHGNEIKPIKTRHPPKFAPLSHYLSASILVGATVVPSMLLRATLNLPDLEMVYLLTVMISAVWFGRGPSILAATIGVTSYNFFFVPPYYDLSIQDSRYFLTFCMMFGVSFTMSELATRLKRQERAAVSREERTAALYELTRELAQADLPAQIGAIAARHASNTFGAKVIVLATGDGGELHSVSALPEGTELNDNDIGVAKWAYEHRELAGLGTDTLPGARVLCAPLWAGPSRLGVLVLLPRNDGAFNSDQRTFLDVFCRQTATALERARLAEGATRAELRARTEEMRSSLLSAVSHDLRTPLGAITGAATSLRDDTALNAATREELVESIVDEAERLERLVANLLDMTRLESGALALKRDWVPLDEMIGSALTRLEAKLGSRKVNVAIAPDMPLVLVDPVLFEQVLVNLLENAVKYTPEGSLLEIVARSNGGRAEIEVHDYGNGIPKGAEEKVFEKFYRGPHAGASGAGLGLAICRGIVEAHGGMISAENRRNGATFRLSLPSGGTPPLLAPNRDDP